MAQTERTISFLATGQKERGSVPGMLTPAAGMKLNANVKDAIALTSTRGGDDFRLDAQCGLHYVVLQIKNGPALVLHPESDIRLKDAPPPLGNLFETVDVDESSVSSSYQKKDP